MLKIGDIAPDFEAKTTEGRIRFRSWIGDSWAVLFSHPKDFTPVCTTELGYMARIKPEFDKRNARIIGLSVDPVANHNKWATDIRETQGHAPNYPMICDPPENLQPTPCCRPGNHSSSCYRGRQHAVGAWRFSGRCRRSWGSWARAPASPPDVSRPLVMVRHRVHAGSPMILAFRLSNSGLILAM